MSKSRRENMVARKKAEKRQRQRAAQTLAAEAARRRWREEQLASGMPPDVFALARALGVR